MYLQTLKNTLFKKDTTLQGSELVKQTKFKFCEIPKDTLYPVKAYKKIPNNHYQVILDIDLQGFNTWNVFDDHVRFGTTKEELDAPLKLNYKMIYKASRIYDLDVALVQTLLEVDSLGNGFLPNHLPVILFEAQWFSALTKGIYDKSHPHISNPKWDRFLYKGGVGEWDRLNEAINLNKEAAYKATRWGLFQIAGFNYKLTGYGTIYAFVKDMHLNEYRQLNAGLSFINHANLLEHLRKKDFRTFSRGYNGENYEKNNYLQKFTKAYQKYSKTLEI